MSAMALSDALFHSRSITRRKRTPYRAARAFYLFLAVGALLAICATFTWHDGLERQRNGGFSLESQSLLTSKHLQSRDVNPNLNDDEECRLVHRSSDQCSFIKKHCPDDEAGFTAYLDLYFCKLPHVKAVAFIILISWLGLLFSTIGIAASDFFCINLSTIANILGMSESMAGVTLLAFGNGSPDVFSTFAAMSTNSGSLAVGELMGAAGFITAVVAGSMALIKPFHVARKSFVRDVGFFIVAAAFSLSFLWDGRLHLWECITMVVYYCLYVVFVVAWHWWIGRKRRRREMLAAARGHFVLPGDELDAEGEYHDDEDEPETRPTLSRGASREDFAALERGAGASYPDDGDEDEEEEARDRWMSELNSNMRLLRPQARSRRNTITPVRPSLVGALEFQAVLNSLQKSRNIQTIPLSSRRYSDDLTFTSLQLQDQMSSPSDPAVRPVPKLTLDSSAAPAPEAAGLEVPKSAPARTRAVSANDAHGLRFQPDFAWLRPQKGAQERQLVDVSDDTPQERSATPQLEVPGYGQHSSAPHSPLSPLSPHTPHTPSTLHHSSTPLQSSAPHTPHVPSTLHSAHTPQTSHTPHHSSAPHTPHTLLTPTLEVTQPSPGLPAPQPPQRQASHSPDHLAASDAESLGRKNEDYFATKSILRKPEDEHDSPRTVPHARQLPKIVIPRERRSRESTPSSTPFPAYRELNSASSSRPPSLYLPPSIASPPSLPISQSAEQEAPSRPTRWWPYSILPPPGVLISTLFPTIYHWREKSIWEKMIGIVAAPSVFFLTITLPVVESEKDGDDSDVPVQPTSYDSARSRNIGSVLDEHASGSKHDPSRDSYTPGSHQHHSSIGGLGGTAAVATATEQRHRNNYGTPAHELPTIALETQHLMASPSLLPSIDSPTSSSPPEPWNRWLTLIQLFTAPIFCLLAIYSQSPSTIGPAWLRLPVLISLLASLIVLIPFLLTTTPTHRPSFYRPLLSALGFLVSIAWISTIAAQVVGALKALAVICNMSHAIMGLTIFAVGNSLGDLVADVTVAKLGYPVMALSACFGGPMLNILLGIGLSGTWILIRGAEHRQRKHPGSDLRFKTYHIDVGRTLIVSGITLLVTLVGLLVCVPLNRWVLSRRIGWVLIALWTVSTLGNVVLEVSGWGSGRED